MSELPPPPPEPLFQEVPKQKRKRHWHIRGLRLPTFSEVKRGFAAIFLLCDLGMGLFLLGSSIGLALVMFASAFIMIDYLWKLRGQTEMPAKKVFNEF